ncbi:MAG: hypothetical protein WC728_13455 [Elusimicrobiota bacterium]
MRTLLLLSSLVLAAPADKLPETASSWDGLDKLLQDLEGTRTRAESLESELLSLQESYADRWDDPELMIRRGELREGLRQAAADIHMIKGSFRRTLGVMSYKMVAREGPAAFHKKGILGVGKAALKVVGYDAQAHAMIKMADELDSFLLKDERSYALIAAEARMRSMKRLAAASLILLGLAGWWTLRFIKRNLRRSLPRR